MTENPIITRPITTFKGRQLSVFYCFRERNFQTSRTKE